VNSLLHRLCFVFYFQNGRVGPEIPRSKAGAQFCFAWVHLNHLVVAISFDAIRRGFSAKY
jgi:hypothetical protein